MHGSGGPGTRKTWPQVAMCFGEKVQHLAQCDSIGAGKIDLVSFSHPTCNGGGAGGAGGASNGQLWRHFKGRIMAPIN